MENILIMQMKQRPPRWLSLPGHGSSLLPCQGAPWASKPGMKTTPRAEPLSGSEPLSPWSTQCLPGAQLRASGILTLPGIIWARFHTSPAEKAPPHVRLYGYRPRPQSGWIPGSLGSLAQARILPTTRGTSLWVPHVPLLFTPLLWEFNEVMDIYIKSIVLRHTL